MSERSSSMFARSEPPTLDHMIGQRRVVERVKVALEAAIADGTRLPHMLFVGVAGSGKTMLASLLAREMGSPLHTSLGSTLAFPPSMNNWLLGPSNRDVGLIDEIHTLGSLGQHSLLRALEDGRIYVNRSPMDKPVEVEINDFTVIGATTDEHLLIKPLRDRFRLVLRFDFYSADDLHELLRQRIKRLGWDVEDEAIEPIARRALGTPRIALRLLESAHRTSRAQGSDRITRAHVERTVELEGLCSAGLDELHQRYLSILATANRPLRLNVLASELGLPKATISEVVEPTLIRLGFLLKDESRRLITEAGLNHLASQTMCRPSGASQ